MHRFPNEVTDGEPESIQEPPCTGYEGPLVVAERLAQRSCVAARLQQMPAADENEIQIYISH